MKAGFLRFSLYISVAMFLITGVINPVKGQQAPTATIYAVKNVSCYGQSTGSATVSATGGITPYSYLWSTSPQQTTQTATGLSVGTYTVTVKDVTGSFDAGSIASVSITQPGVPSAGPNDTICPGGAVQLNATGGVIYTWSPATGLSNPNIANPLASPTVTTTYTVTISNSTGDLTTNGDFSSGNTGFASGYTFVNTAYNGSSSSGLWPEGTYAICSNVRSPILYHPAFYGHGHGGGSGSAQLGTNFMALNGSTVSGTVAWSENVNVQQNTDYNFSAWISTLHLPGPFATLRFSINGTPLGPTIQAPSDTTSFSQFFAVWNSGSTTTALIQIVNTDVVAGSNDFGLDDILFTTLCNSVSSLTVVVSNITIGMSHNNSCSGGSTGTATASPSGGTSPYSYLWSTSPPQTTQTATSLSGGTYIVTVSDAHSCTKTASVTISQSNALTLVTDISNVSCNGTSTGCVFLTVTGGTNPISYSWSNHQTTQSICGLSAGTYTVTVTDLNGCNATTSRQVSQPGPLTAPVGTTPVSCFNGNNGTATVSASGGNGGNSYKWSTSPGQTTQTATGLISGTYTVTVTDSKGCSTTGSGTVTQPSLLTAIASAKLVSCYNFNNGQASVTASGGNGGYTYLWNSTPPQTTQRATGLIATTYTVTVTDSKNCTTSTSVLVGQPASPDAGPDQTICLGGSAQLDATGGLLYHWSPSTGLSNPDIFNPVASPTVTTTYYVTITNPSGDLVVNGDFSGGNTAFTSPGYVFVPNPLPYPYGGPGGLWPEGTYTVCAEPKYYHGADLPWGGHDHTTGTGLFMAVNGNTVPNEIVWKENVTVVPNTNYDFITWVATCFETSSALLNFSINGVALGPTITAPSDTDVWVQFHAEWNSGSNTSAIIQIINANTVAFGNDFGLDDILFTTTCSNVDSLVVHVEHVTAEITNSNPTCYSGINGFATVTASGGNGNYTYRWSTAPVQTTQTATGLAAGTYSVTVTDGLGCTGTAMTTISQPPPINVNAGPDQFLCNQTNTILLGSDPTPGTGNWTQYTGPNNPIIFPSNSAIAIVAGMIPGIYQFIYTVTIPVGEQQYCTNSDTMMVTNYHFPSAAFAGPDQQLCKSAGPDSTWLNGNIPVWGSGKWKEMSGPNMANIVNAFNPSTKVKNLIDGVYDFRWSVGNGICDSSFSDMHITVHTMPTANAGPDATICGGSLDTLKYSSATNYCSLSWITLGSGYFNNAGTLHPIYVPSAGDIAAGHVKLILVANGCPPCGNARDTMLLNITAPPVANAGPDASICQFSDFCLCGATAYHYTTLWWTTTGCGTFNNPNILNPVYTPCPGDLITGCVKLILHVMGTPPCGVVTDTMELCIRRIPIVYAGPDTTICSQGTYTILLSTALYQASLKWKTSGDGTFNKDTILHPTYTPGAGDLAAGHVTLTLIGIACSPCPNDSDKMVLSFSYPPVVHASTITNVNCFGGNDGSITITVTGGRTPYYYHWNDVAQQTTKTATGLIAGTYTVTVTDYYNCTATASSTVTQPTQLNVQCMSTNISCYTYSDGAVTITVSGGSPVYHYGWSNGKTTQNLTGLTAGTYTVTVTDTHGCTTMCSSTVTQPPPWGPQICGMDSVCQGSIVQYCVCEPLRQGSTYQWTVTCGTIIDGCCSHCVTIQWDHCAHGTICVTETRHDAPYDGCIITTCKTIILKPVPAPAITGPQIVMAGQTGAVYCTPFYPGHLYSWSVVDGTVTAGQGTNCITVTWNSPCGSCMGQVIAYETLNGCCGTDTLNVTIIPGTGNLDGYVTYLNPYNTGLNGVAVTLRNSSGVVVGTAYTGPNTGNNQDGYYTFPGIPNGAYHLTASFNGTWGGNNATDALIIELYTVGMYPLSGLNRKAGDVNADLIVNATDALWVKLRTVGVMNSYPAGDWTFTDTMFTLTTMATVNLKGLCVGDVNGSYIPTGLKETSFLSVKDDGVMTIPVNKDFTYSIRSSASSDLGAMTLFMGYNPDRYEVEDLTTTLEGMKYVIRDGQIRLAWSNTSPLTVRENEPILTLRMKAKEAITVPSQIFEVKPGSEFADAGAVRYDNFELKMSSVVTPDNAMGFSVYNFPNPFQNTTDIVYTLPEQGHVRLVLTNMFGEELSTLVDADQSSGTYTIRVNPLDDNLKSGVYLYKIKVDGVTTTYFKVNKMIFTK